VRGLFFALVLVGAPVSTPALALTPNPMEPPTDERTPAQIEQERLSRFLLKPIGEAAKESPDLRRVTFIDLFDGPSSPGVTFERQADGQVAMTVVSERGSVVDKATLKPEAWAYITAPDILPLTRRKPVAQTSKQMCHGTQAVIEAVDAGKTARYDAHVCNGQADLPALEFARRLANLAVNSIPRCDLFREHARDPAWVLTECMRRTNRDVARNELAGNETNIRGPALDFVLATTTEKRGPVEPSGRRGAGDN